VARALGGVKPPGRDPDLQPVITRATRLQMIGYASAALAVLLVLLGAFKMIR
jgi:hypothetical protein